MLNIVLLESPQWANSSLIILMVQVHQYISHQQKVYNGYFEEGPIPTQLFTPKFQTLKLGHRWLTMRNTPSGGVNFRYDTQLLMGGSPNLTHTILGLNGQATHYQHSCETLDTLFSSYSPIIASFHFFLSLHVHVLANFISFYPCTYFHLKTIVGCFWCSILQTKVNFICLNIEKRKKNKREQLYIIQKYCLYHMAN